MHQAAVLEPFPFPVNVPKSMLIAAENGETLDVGRDPGVTVTEYHTPHGRIEGEIPHVGFNFD